MAGIYARQIAEFGYIGIVINNGGPATVAPHGESIPYWELIQLPLNTNFTRSIGFGYGYFRATLGEVNLAKVENRPLVEKAFLDKGGEFTTDSDKAAAIIPFAGYKGYGLNFMIEILTGAFVSAKMELQSQNAYDLGFLFIAYAPDMFTTKEKFDSQVIQLVTRLRSLENSLGK